MTGNPLTREDDHAQEREAGIAVYLEQHPDFFERHPALLTSLSLPHDSGGAVSLVQRQVEALRAETGQYRQQIRELVQVARDNDRLTQRLHRLTIALIDAADFSEVLNILEDHLHGDLEADAVELRLFSAEGVREERAAAQAGHADPAFLAFSEIFDQGRPLCGRLSGTQLHYLFGAQADDVGSAALLPLRSEEILGVLAIGSSDPERFHAEMGTELLERLAEVVSHKLRAVSLPGV